MIRSALIEYLILQNVETVGDGSRGLPTTWGGLSGIIRQNGPKVGMPDVQARELRDALKRLYGGHHLALDKWEDAVKSFRPYSDYNDDDEFFFKNQFRMRLTPEGRQYFEQLEASILPQSPAKRPKIGF